MNKHSNTKVNHKPIVQKAQLKTQIGEVPRGASSVSSTLYKWCKATASGLDPEGEADNRHI